MRHFVNTIARKSLPLDALEAVLRGLPLLREIRRRPDVEEGSRAHDAVLQLQFRHGPSQRWIVELRNKPVEPYTAGLQALGLPAATAAAKADYAVVVAPFVSARSAEILTRAGVGYCDASGNCRLASGPIYIERTGFRNAFARKARQGALFTRGSERVLRALLDPAGQGRRWTMRELAEAAWPGVSVGQAHKVAGRLESEAFLRREEAGLRVVDPGKLLEAWAAGYRFERNEEQRFYTPIAARELRERATALLARGRKGLPPGVLASFSAAEVLAPFVRQHRFFLYWRGDVKPLVKALELTAVGTGESVVVYTPYDEGVLYPAGSGDPPVTSPVQTYLDLRAAPGRGEEAAQAVFDKYLRRAYRR